MLVCARNSLFSAIVFTFLSSDRRRSSTRPALPADGLLLGHSRLRPEPLRLYPHTPVDDAFVRSVQCVKAAGRHIAFAAYLTQPRHLAESLWNDVGRRRSISLQSGNLLHNVTASTSNTSHIK